MSNISKFKVVNERVAKSFENDRIKKNSDELKTVMTALNECKNPEVKKELLERACAAFVQVKEDTHRVEGDKSPLY